MNKLQLMSPNLEPFPREELERLDEIDVLFVLLFQVTTSEEIRTGTHDSILFVVADHHNEPGREIL